MVRDIRAPKIVPMALFAALAFGVAPYGAAYADNDKKDDIDRSVVQQGFDASPIPKEKLNLKGKDPYLVGLGSYLVNGAGDCNGCHTFPRFLRPQGTLPTPANSTANTSNQGSNPSYGNPYLDLIEQSLKGQLKANTNVKHFLAGGRCFGFFMSRNITPNDYGLPRGLTEAEFIQVMRQGKDISCGEDRPVQNQPIYGGAYDPVCSTREGAGAGTSFNAEVLQTMPWPTYHSMTDTDLKAIYAYLSALPQATACNTVDNGCAGWFGAAQGAGEVGTNRYRYANTDDCPNNYNPVGPARTGDDHLPYGVAPPQ
jgi:hypothetical protein